jgi:predicted RNase H-like HicB family nuclease
MRLTAIIEREDEGFVSLCPELDIVSQGSSVEEAQANLVEALTLFFETADASEVTRRFLVEVRQCGSYWTARLRRRPER